MEVIYKKLTNGPVREGKNFCIARIEGDQLAEIEGRFSKGVYTISLFHQPGYVETYERYGLASNEMEWGVAIDLLKTQVQHHETCQNTKQAPPETAQEIQS